MMKISRVLIASVCLFSFSIAVSSTARAAENTLSQSQKEEVHQAVKDFFAQNPEAVMQAMQNFQKNQQDKKMEMAGAVTEKFMSEESGNRNLYGSPDAKITLIVYADFDCPYCKRLHPTAKQLVDESSGEVNWIYRQLPLPMHPEAATKAQGAECAFDLGGNDAFWKFTDGLVTEKPTPAAELAALAKQVGLDEAKFQDCLNSGKNKDRVQKDIDDAHASGITGTPGLVFFSKETKKANPVFGALPLESLKAEMQKVK